MAYGQAETTLPLCRLLHYTKAFRRAESACCTTNESGSFFRSKEGRKINKCKFCGYGCLRCRKTFSGPRRCGGNMYLPFETVRRAAELIAEGNSIRSTSRLLGIQSATVLSLLARVEAGCSELLRSRIWGLDVRHLELDEVWTFLFSQCPLAR